MARNKKNAFKIMLNTERKRRMRAPIWANLRAKKRLFPRISRIHWRRTKLGHEVRRKLGIMK